MTRETKTEAARALRQLLAARKGLAAVQAEIDREAETSAPGSDEAKTALQLQRTLNHIGEAIADVPPALWGAMLKDYHISIADLRATLNGPGGEVAERTEVAA
jgi:hypothetical protein